MLIKQGEGYDNPFYVLQMSNNKLFRTRSFNVKKLFIKNKKNT